MFVISPVIFVALSAAPTATPVSGLWETLANPDPMIAYEALFELVDRPDEAVPFISKNLAPTESVDASTLNKLLTGLSSTSFRDREKATAQLLTLGSEVEPTLRKWSEKKDLSAEAKRRLDLVLRRMTDRASPERLRQRRAIQVLEYTATAPAREALRGLAKGPEGI